MGEAAAGIEPLSELFFEILSESEGHKKSEWRKPVCRPNTFFNQHFKIEKYNIRQSPAAAPKHDRNFYRYKVPLNYRILKTLPETA